MTVPFWCLFIAVLLPYVLAGIGGYYRAQQFGSVDNEHPRSQAVKLEGAGARAIAAQANAWEAVAVFTAAVVVAHLAGANPRLSAIACELFLLARVLHAFAYVRGLPTLRSSAFLVGLVSCIGLFVLAAMA